jgi:hypothetical protein
MSYTDGKNISWWSKNLKDRLDLKLPVFFLQNDKLTEHFLSAIGVSVSKSGIWHINKYNNNNANNNE